MCLIPSTISLTVLKITKQTRVNEPELLHLAYIAKVAVMHTRISNGLDKTYTGK
jgi:hypothetical protein